MEDTLTEALGIIDSWADKNLKNIGKDFSQSDSVSEVIEKTALRIKNEEFGEASEEYTLTEYEKKLVLAGLHIGHLLLQMKAHQSMESIISSILREGRK